MWFAQPIEVIPAVDVLGEGAVRLHQGDYDDVVEQGRQSDCARAALELLRAPSALHLVDLDGARSGRARPELVRAVALAAAPALLQASGGIRTLADARALLEAGADRVVVGTAAWPDPTPWLQLGEALVLALDVRDGEVRSSGWTRAAGLSFDAALERAQGAARVLVTSIDRDGTLAGPDLDLVRSATATGVRVLAAGGIRSPADVQALAAAGAEAAIVGRALLL